MEAAGKDRRISLYLQGENPLLRIDIQERCVEHPDHTLLLSIRDTIFPVVLPDYADVVYMHQRIVGIDHLQYEELQLGSVYAFSDQSTQRVFDVGPWELLGSLRNISWTQRTVLNPPRYINQILRDGDTDLTDIQLAIVDENGIESREFSFDRKNNVGEMQVGVESTEGVSVLESIQIRIVQIGESDAPVLPVDYVRVEIHREDATRSTFLYQNSHSSKESILIPPFSIQKGDRIVLRFLEKRSSL
jgi:hypothetical protein